MKKVCRVPFSIEKIYKGDLVCDVKNMDACHLLLGRSWQFDVNALYRERDNVYEFWWNRKKVHLVPLTNKKKNSKAKEKNFLTIVKGHLEGDCDGYKKLQKEDEFKVESIPRKVQQLLAEFTDITPIKMPYGLLPL